MNRNRQFARYVVVGLASNLTIYIAYILLTQMGMGPKLSMSILYGLGVLQSFIFNMKWSFRFEGAIRPALARYFASYAIGYIINFIALFLLVDLCGFSHQIIQGTMIIFIATLLFVAQKYWVFPKRTGSTLK